MISYEDLELLIQPTGQDEYQLYVVHSPVGETSATMQFPFDEMTLNNRLLTLENVLLRSSGKRRRMVTEDEEAFREFGQNLFDATFIGNIRNCYERSIDRATQQGKGLRIRLRIQDPLLASLPWEYLYDSGQEEYICLSTNRPIVRYPDFLNPIEPLTVALPLRILGMVATPMELNTLDVDREKERMETALRNLQDSGLIELTWLEGQTWRHLQREMLGGPWHVFHFVGHGGFQEQADEGAVSLCDEEGHEFRIGATQLGRLLADHHPLRLVFLNSCEGARGGRTDMFSSTASMLVRRGISSVVAMQYEISDDAAIEFARCFYETLAGGIPVDAAVATARKAIDIGLGNTMEWGVPVLYMRAPDGVLFNIQERVIGEGGEHAKTGGEHLEEEQLEAEQRVREDVEQKERKYEEVEAEKTKTEYEHEEQEQLEAKQRVREDIERRAHQYEEVEVEQKRREVQDKVTGEGGERKQIEQRQQTRSRLSWRFWGIITIIVSALMTLWGTALYLLTVVPVSVIVITCTLAYKELPQWKALGLRLLLLHIVAAATSIIVLAITDPFFFGEIGALWLLTVVIAIPVNFILAWMFVRIRKRRAG